MPRPNPVLRGRGRCHLRLPLLSKPTDSNDTAAAAGGWVHPPPKFRPFSTSTSAPSPPPNPTFPDPAAALAPDNVVGMLPSLAESAAALALFCPLSTRLEMDRIMRLYATATTTFVARQNLPMVHEAVCAMVAAFAEVGRLQEAADMAPETRSHGLPLRFETANWVLRVGLALPGCFALAYRVFDGMAARCGKVRPDTHSFRALVLGCYRERLVGVRLALDMWVERFCLDNATYTTLVRAFCQQGRCL